VLLAATNHEQLLDPAVWRRFSYRLQIHLPPDALREALLKAYLHRFAPEGSLKRAVELSEGLSGGLMRHAVEDCIREAVLQQKTTVSEGRLLARLAHVVLTARNLIPSTDSVADLLLRSGTPLRVVAEGTGISMRQLLKRSDAVDRKHKKRKGEQDGDPGESGSRR
jgi:SpoVK/Ycf46/Vps4 family AAA+-type ATPase